LAIDFSTGKAFVAVNNSWLGSGNPVTEANPTVTFSGAGALYAAISFAGNIGSWTLQATSASQTYSPPSGYSAWK
jgi:hypothetical protein